MKIAVIDDERPARKMLIRRVKEVRPDCEITEAESGSDALKMFNESDSFDLIFVDMELGDMEGTTLAATAKRLFPKTKIVFATAYSQYAAKAYEMEIDDYILKPFDPDRVRHVIEKCMKDWLPEGDHPFRKLYSEYSKLHDKNNEDDVSKTPWSYSQYYSGEQIDDKLRGEYRNNNDVMFSVEDPFEMSNNEIRSILNGVRETKIKKVMKSLQKYGTRVTVKKIIEHLK